MEVSNDPSDSDDFRQPGKNKNYRRGNDIYRNIKHVGIIIKINYQGEENL